MMHSLFAQEATNHTTPALHDLANLLTFSRLELKNSPELM